MLPFLQGQWTSAIILLQVHYVSQRGHKGQNGKGETRGLHVSGGSSTHKYYKGLIELASKYTNKEFAPHMFHDWI